MLPPADERKQSHLELQTLHTNGPFITETPGLSAFLHLETERNGKRFVPRGFRGGFFNHLSPFIVTACCACS